MLEYLSVLTNKLGEIDLLSTLKTCCDDVIAKFPSRSQGIAQHVVEAGKRRQANDLARCTSSTNLLPACCSNLLSEVLVELEGWIANLARETECDGLLREQALVHEASDVFNSPDLLKPLRQTCRHRPRTPDSHATHDFVDTSETVEDLVRSLLDRKRPT